MKNKDKYPNTDEAMAAYKKHRDEHKCDCTLEDWLNLDEEEMRRFNKKLKSAMMFSLFAGSLSSLRAILKDAEEKHGKDCKDKAEPKKSSDNDELTGIECPVCHGKNGEIDDVGFMGVTFVCKDCGIYLDRSTRVTGKALSSVSDAKLFLADLCKKNCKKD